MAAFLPVSVPETPIFTSRLNRPRSFSNLHEPFEPPAFLLKRSVLQLAVFLCVPLVGSFYVGETLSAVGL